MSLDQQALDALYYNVATEHGFFDKEVPQELLEKAVEMALLGPTAYNIAPGRIVFVKSSEGKAKLQECLMEGNKNQTSQAYVTAIVCIDEEFYKHLPKLMPAVPGVENYFLPDQPSTAVAKVRNANLFAGYFIMALRALGLGAGPMSGFSNEAVDAAFLEGTTWKSNFLINIGYADVSKRYPRAPRFTFDEATKFA